MPALSAEGVCLNVVPRMLHLRSTSLRQSAPQERVESSAEVRKLVRSSRLLRVCVAPSSHTICKLSVALCCEEGASVAPSLLRPLLRSAANLLLLLCPFL